MTRDSCTKAGGTYLGDGADCASCLSNCPCDWNGDGRLTNADLYAFTQDYFAGHADFNHDGVTNEADFMEFTSCMLQPPPPCRAGGQPAPPK